MRKIVIVLGTLTLLAACQPEQSAQISTDNASAKTATAVEQQVKTESERLNDWFDAKYEEQLLSSPIMLTFLGRKERYNEINDMSEAEEKRQLAWQAATVSELKGTFYY